MAGKKQAPIKPNYGNKVGLDFGTTYSVISRIKEKQGGHISVEACALREYVVPKSNPTLFP